MCFDQGQNPVTDLTHGDVREQLQTLAGRGIDWNANLAAGHFAVARARPAAVLVLFGALDNIPSRHRSPRVPNDLDLLLIERASTLNDHPGQIAFPGGRIDPEDAGPEAAALREAVEETGLDPHGVDLLGPLATLPLPVSRHEVTPVLGWWARDSPIGVVDPAESAHVFRTPVGDLLDPANRRTTTLAAGAGTMRSPGFLIDGRLIWGFTGIVLSAILEELGWTEPWDTSQEFEIPH